MNKKICVLGGTGFVGHHLVNQLSRAGHQVSILTRHRERHRDLLVLPGVEVITANVHDTAQLQQHFSGKDAVINLVAILNEPRDNGRTFRRVHVELTQKVIEACQASGVTRLLHMSALHADAVNGTSYYLRSKGEAEDLAHAARGLDVTSFRPSVIFGHDDSFFNRFACLLYRVPFAFPIACGEARFAPVCVDDVASAMLKSLAQRHTFGQRYNLCGPKTYTLKQLLAFTAQCIGVKRRVISLGKSLSLLQANLLQYAPGKPFSRDNYRSMQLDSICEEGSDTLQSVFHITPSSIEAVVPRYLQDQSCRRRYDSFRQQAHRD